MPYKKSDLKAIKQNLSKTNPEVFERKNNRKKKSVRMNVVDYKEKESIKTKTIWTFKPNDLVLYNAKIAIVISDKEYHRRKHIENYFFIFVDGTIKQIEGRYLSYL